jgi:hypothetical protein
MSAPTTNPPVTASDAPKPQATRHVPGAGDLLSKVSGTKTTSDTNVALLSKAPNAGDLPAELRGEQGDIERELKEDAAAVAAAGGHEKGAVGEAVSRRMKVLTKKIVSRAFYFQDLIHLLSRGSHQTAYPCALITATIPRLHRKARSRTQPGPESGDRDVAGA